MREIINEDVSVVMIYNAKQHTALPHMIGWHNKTYKVGKIGYYHSIKVGNVSHHIYELVDSDNSLWFRLNLDTSNLQWRLEAIHDGLAT